MYRIQSVLTPTGVQHNDSFTSNPTVTAYIISYISYITSHHITSHHITIQKTTA